MIDKRLAVVSAAMIAAISLGAAAQDQGSSHHPMTPGSSPYAGLEARPIKALSDQQIADLKAGRGMGLALPAELNGYPGPRHVLDLADQLRLSEQQYAATQRLFDAMKAETIPIGERVIADESLLDRMFAEQKVTPAALAELTGRIGAAQGELRAAHLRYHLSMMEVLSADQVAHYRVLRGYGEQSHHSEGMH